MIGSGFRGRINKYDKMLSLSRLLLNRRRQQGGTLGSSRSSSSSSSFCIDLVRSRDRDHYLTNLLLPAALQQLAFALRALNIQLSDVLDSVRGDGNNSMGGIRFQFWIDAVEAVLPADPYAEPRRPRMPPNQPVVTELSKNIKKIRGKDGSDISLGTKQLLLDMVSAKQVFLSQHPFSRIEDVEENAKNSFSSTNQLILKGLANQKGQDKVNPHAMHSGHHLGLAEGLVTLLRGVPHNARHNQVYLPTALLEQHNLRREDVVRMAQMGNASDFKLKGVCELLAARADQHLENCRFRAKHLNAEEKLVMLPAVTVDSYLTQLHKANCDVLNSRLQKSDPLVPLKLYIMKVRKKY